MFCITLRFHLANMRSISLNNKLIFLLLRYYVSFIIFQIYGFLCNVHQIRIESASFSYGNRIEILSRWATVQLPQCINPTEYHFCHQKPIKIGNCYTKMILGDFNSIIWNKTRYNKKKNIYIYIDNYESSSW